MIKASKTSHRKLPWDARLAGILRLSSATNCQLLHYPRVSVHNDRLTAAFANTLKPAPRVKTLGDGRGGYCLTQTMRLNDDKYWYQHLYISRDPTQPAGGIVLGLFKVAERERLHTILCAIRDVGRPSSLTAPQ